MAPVQNYAATPSIGAAVLSAANPNRNGTGTVVNILTAGIYGARIDKITIKAVGNTTDGMVRIFLFDGTTYFLYDEASIGAITVDALTPGFRRTLATLALDLPANWSLRASTGNAELLHFIAEGATY